MAGMNWKEYNEALVRRGQVLFDPVFLIYWSDELKGMNDGKEGARYKYPQSFMEFLAVIHAYLLPYRQLEGFLRAMSAYVEGLKVPDYSTIWWRVNRMKVDIDPDINPNEEVTIAVDSSGIKVTNRGDWLNEKWKVRKGYLKMHIAVDVKTGKILSLEVTKEDVHDNRMFRDLVDGSGDRAKVTRVLADGAYDSRGNFTYLSEKGIEPVIKVRRNSSRRARGCMPRKLSAVEQLDDHEGWKRKHGYGMRWMVEAAFSAFKRAFGEHVLAKSMQNMIRELIIKANLYNLFMSMKP